MKTLYRLIVASLLAFSLPAFAYNGVNAGIMPWSNSALVLNGAMVSTTNPLPTVAGAPTVARATPLQGTITTATSLTLTPPANSNLRLLHLDVSDNATQTTAGVITVTATLNGVVVYVGGVYGPATALSNAGSLFQTSLNFAAVAPNDGTGSLVITLSGALTAGTIFVNAYFD